jgi:hypothetical protein
MMILRNITALVLVLVTSAGVSEVKAQNRGTLINVDYSIAAPLGETRTHTADNSFQGLGFEVRHFYKHFVGGLGVSWQVFRDEKQAPGTPSGAEFEARTTSLVPVLATAYFRSKHGMLQTFFGVGVGTMLYRRTLEERGEETIDKTWYAAASVTAGGLVEVSSGFGVESKLRYDAGFKKGYKSPQMIQLTLGFIFIY